MAARARSRGLTLSPPASAGEHLVLATLLAARRAGLPMPAAAALLSPVTDVAMTGESMRSKNDVGPIFTPEILAEPFAA